MDPHNNRLISELLPMGSVFAVCLTHFVQPNIVFAQRSVAGEDERGDKERSREMDQFLALMKELSEQAEAFPQVQAPQKGHAYCARYTHDNEWYRCTITSVEGQDVCVHYVDYGNSEILPLSKLRKPTQHFVDFPLQSYITRIRGLEIRKPEESQEIYKRLSETLFQSEEKQVFARVKLVDGYYEADLYHRSEGGELQLVYKKLVDEGLIAILD